MPSNSVDCAIKHFDCALHTANEDQSGKILFIREQLQLLQQKPERLRCSPSLLVSCFTLASSSTSTYQCLLHQNVLTLPSIKTLGKITRAVNPNIDAIVGEYLSKRYAKLSHYETQVAHIFWRNIPPELSSNRETDGLAEKILNFIPCDDFSISDEMDSNTIFFVAGALCRTQTKKKCPSCISLLTLNNNVLNSNPINQIEHKQFFNSLDRSGLIDPSQTSFEFILKMWKIFSLIEQDGALMKKWVLHIHILHIFIWYFY